MRRGPEGRGKQIRVSLAGTGRSIMHPGHHTRTTTFDKTTTTTPSTSRDSHMDNRQMHQRRLQCHELNGKQADCKAANTTTHQAHRCRNEDSSANGPHASRLTLNQPDLQG